MDTFWSRLPKPFFASAPMADVTDAAFRGLLARYGKPDVMWTEFVSADGLHYLAERAPEQKQNFENLRELSNRRARTDASDMQDSDSTIIYDSAEHVTESGLTGEAESAADSAGANPLLGDLRYTEGERPIVAQIFSSKPDMIAYATKLVAELGFDGVDLNMGCPDRSIEKQGCGSAMIKTPEAARAVIRAAKAASSLPVSVKTRVGYNKETLDEWLPVILEESPAAVTLHLRTRKELSLVPADWELMKRAVALRDRIAPGVLLIGNGDVDSLADGKQRAAETGCDGIMIGRGMFGNPWVFAGRTSSETPLTEKLAALVELAHAFEELTPRKNFALLKKHIKAFVTGFDGAADLRARLMAASNANELAMMINKKPAEAGFLPAS